MQEELDFMNARIGDIFNDAFFKYPMNFCRVQTLNREEVNAYKVKLEIFFSETDIKEQTNITIGEKSHCIDIISKEREKTGVDCVVKC